MDWHPEAVVPNKDGKEGDIRKYFKKAKPEADSDAMDVTAAVLGYDDGVYAIWEEPDLLREFVKDLVDTGGPEADDEGQEEQRQTWPEELGEGWEIEDLYEDD